MTIFNYLTSGLGGDQYDPYRELIRQQQMKQMIGMHPLSRKAREECEKSFVGINPAHKETEPKKEDEAILLLTEEE